MHFEGKGTDTLKIAHEFSNLVLDYNETVLFPLSDKSHRTVKKALDPKQYREVVVYKTELVERELDQIFDILVFTSPSNVKGFLKSGNRTPPSAQVMSIGNSTKAELRKNGIQSTISWEHTELALADRVAAILC